MGVAPRIVLKAFDLLTTKSRYVQLLNTSSHTLLEDQLNSYILVRLLGDTDLAPAESDQNRAVALAIMVVKAVREVA